MIKDGIKEILGKTIKGVVIKRKEEFGEDVQVFLLFTDNTHYEFYSDWFGGPARVSNGGLKEVRDTIPEHPIRLELVNDSLGEN